MTVRARRLIDGSQLTTSQVTYYTAPANSRVIIQKLTLTNTTGTARTATVYLVPDGGSPTASNTLLSAVTVAAGYTMDVVEAAGHVLEAEGTIRALADAGTAVTIQASGVVVE